MTREILDDVTIAECNTDSRPLRKPAFESNLNNRRLNGAQVPTMQQSIGLANSPLLKIQTLKENGLISK